LMDDDYVRIQNFELQQEQFPLLLLVQISCGVKYFQMEMFCTANFSPPDCEFVFISTGVILNDETVYQLCKQAVSQVHLFPWYFYSYGWVCKCSIT
jgi:hypothetical protein